MTYLTKQEYEDVKAKVKQIEDFIRTEILPYIDAIYEIPFGSEKTKSGESRLNLYVLNCADGIHGYSGHLFISFEPDFTPEEVGRGVSIYNSSVYGGNFGYELIANWSRVKSKLLELKTKTSKEAEKRKSVLQSFRV